MVVIIYACSEWYQVMFVNGTLIITEVATMLYLLKQFYKQMIIILKRWGVMYYIFTTLELPIDMAMSELVIYPTRSYWQFCFDNLPVVSVFPIVNWFIDLIVITATKS